MFLLINANILFRIYFFRNIHRHHPCVRAWWSDHRLVRLGVVLLPDRDCHADLHRVHVVPDPRFAGRTSMDRRAREGTAAEEAGNAYTESMSGHRDLTKVWVRRVPGFSLGRGQDVHEGGSGGSPPDIWGSGRESPKFFRFLTIKCPIWLNYGGRIVDPIILSALFVQSPLWEFRTTSYGKFLTRYIYSYEIQILTGSFILHKYFLPAEFLTIHEFLRPMKFFTVVAVSVLAALSAAEGPRNFPHSKFVQFDNMAVQLSFSKPAGERGRRAIVSGYMYTRQRAGTAGSMVTMVLYTWNVHQRTLQGMPRTNNSVEGIRGGISWLERPTRTCTRW